MKFLRGLVLFFLALMALGLIWGCLSVSYTTIAQGGLLRTASPFQLLVMAAPQLLGIFAGVATLYAVLKYSFSKSK